MKNRTDRMLLRSFLVSLLAYGLLLSIYIQCFWSGTITAPILGALERPFFWLAVGGHGVPFFALQLLLCRRCCSAARFDGDYTADEPSGNVWRAWLGYYHMDRSFSVFHRPGGGQPAGLCSLWNPSAEEEKNRPAAR